MLRDRFALHRGIPAQRCIWMQPNEKIPARAGAWVSDRDGGVGLVGPRPTVHNVADSCAFGARGVADRTPQLEKGDLVRAAPGAVTDRAPTVRRPRAGRRPAGAPARGTRRAADQSSVLRLRQRMPAAMRPSRSPSKTAAGFPTS